jgi:hypothetical protein
MILLKDKLLLGLIVLRNFKYCLFSRIAYFWFFTYLISELNYNASKCIRLLSIIIIHCIY